MDQTYRGALYAYKKLERYREDQHVPLRKVDVLYREAFQIFHNHIVTLWVWRLLPAIANWWYFTL